MYFQSMLQSLWIRRSVIKILGTNTIDGKFGSCLLLLILPRNTLVEFFWTHKKNFGLEAPWKETVLVLRHYQGGIICC